MGSSCSIIIENGMIKLGTWQGVYFCEFDVRGQEGFIQRLLGSTRIIVHRLLFI